MDAYETIEKDDWTVSIFQDVDPMSPDDWDNLATFVHTTDYAFGESLGRRNLDDRRDGAYIRALSIFGDDIAAVLPVQITEHGPQVTVYESNAEIANGVLYTTHKRLNELCGEGEQYHTREWALNALRGELTEWRQYLENDVWGYVVTRPDGSDDDSCWGFYGLEHATKEAEEALDACIEREARAIEESNRITAL